MGSFLVRAAVTGLALWVVTPSSRYLVRGRRHHRAEGGHHLRRRRHLRWVNALIKPVVTLLSIPLYILTLGLFHVVVNALMLWITAWITDHTTHWGLHIDKFWWTAIWAAIVLSIVGWVFGLTARNAERTLG